MSQTNEKREVVRRGNGMAASCRMRRLFLALLLTLGLVAILAPRPAAADKGHAIGITKFDFSDNSGEMSNRSATHQAWLKKFSDTLRNNLEKDGRYRVISVACPSDPCVGTPAEGEDLLNAAKKAGADLLVIGGVHKMTSLVIVMKADIYTVATGKPAFSKMYTLRGDNEDAFIRAADVLAGEIKAHN